MLLVLQPSEQEWWPFLRGREVESVLKIAQEDDDNQHTKTNMYKCICMHVYIVHVHCKYTRIVHVAYTCTLLHSYTLPLTPFLPLYKHTHTHTHTHTQQPKLCASLADIPTLSNTHNYDLLIASMKPLNLQAGTRGSGSSLK